jgi:hypothetical protein
MTETDYEFVMVSMLKRYVDVHSARHTRTFIPLDILGRSFRSTNKYCAISLWQNNVLRIIFNTNQIQTVRWDDIYSVVPTVTGRILQHVPDIFNGNVTRSNTNECSDHSPYLVHKGALLVYSYVTCNQGQCLLKCYIQLPKDDMNHRGRF